MMYRWLLTQQKGLKEREQNNNARDHYKHTHTGERAHSLCVPINKFIYIFIPFSFFTFFKAAFPRLVAARVTITQPSTLFIYHI